jgi:hypothetical protein
MTDTRKRRVKFTIDDEADKLLQIVNEEDLKLMRSRKRIKGWGLMQIMKEDKGRRLLVVMYSLAWVVKLVDSILFNIWA